MCRISEKFNCETVTVELGEVTKITRGKGVYTKEYSMWHKGKYPVYTANNTSPALYIDTYDYSGTYYSVSMNGIAGVTKLLEGDFSITGDRAIITATVSRLSEKYVSAVAQAELRKRTKGRKSGTKGAGEYSKITNRIYNTTKIEIPVTPDGEFDLEKQKEIARFYELQDNFKRETLKGLKALLKPTLVDFEPEKDYETVTVKLKDITVIKRGDGKFTREYALEHPGEYPVYSANNSMPMISVDTYKYEGPKLTVSTNGIAGVTKVIEGKFDITGARGVIEPIVPGLYLPYLKYIIQPKLRKVRKGRTGSQFKSSEYSQLTNKLYYSCSIEIPVTPDGEFDLEKQKELATHYEKVAQVRKYVEEYIANLEKLTF